ncbi:MAG TPA: hypothetical protein VF072_13820 [Thermoleophilaceae bacterium]
MRVTINDFDRGRQVLTEEVVPRVKQAPGFVAGYWTTSEGNDNGLSMVVFESEDAARGVAQIIESQGMNEGVTLEGTEVREVVASA